MKDALVPLPTILVAQLKTHNRTMAIISKFCPKIPRFYTKNALPVFELMLDSLSAVKVKPHQ